MKIELEPEKPKKKSLVLMMATTNIQHNTTKITNNGATID